jgi:hypothetical protein
MNGYTGKVAFDDNGDRINAEYDVVNIQKPSPYIKVLQKSVGKYYYSIVSAYFRIEFLYFYKLI